MRGNSILKATPMASRIALHGPIRISIGLLLAATSLSMLFASESIDWGVAATTVVPALCLMVPALSCLKRKVILIDADGLAIETGWLWRRCQQLSLQDIQLEVLPMAGLWALILHRNERRWPLALWSARKTVDRLAQALDAQAPDGAWPRIQHQAAAWDR